MSITDFEAVKKWAKISQNNQQLLLNNVFCPKCGVTTLVDYTMHNDTFGILLEGKCKKCGSEVVRLVEDE